jgi:hypothetical protein
MAHQFIPAPGLAFAFLIVSLGTQESRRGDHRLWAAASSTKAAPSACLPADPIFAAADYS